MNCQFCSKKICTLPLQRIQRFKYKSHLFESNTSINRFLTYLKCIFDYNTLTPYMNSVNNCSGNGNCSTFVNDSILNFTGKDWEYFLLKKGQQNGQNRQNWSILSTEAIRSTYDVRPIFNLWGHPFSILFIRRQMQGMVPPTYNHVMFHIRNGLVLGRNHPGSKHGIYNIFQLYQLYKDGIRPLGHVGNDVFQMEYISVEEVFRSLSIRI